VATFLGLADTPLGETPSTDWGKVLGMSRPGTAIETEKCIKNGAIYSIAPFLMEFILYVYAL
jgi:hypothetical protein